MKEEICESCDGKHQFSYEEIRYTFRNGRNIPLCKACWEAALQIQSILTPESRAEAARIRYEARRFQTGV
jgi:hypothetical protein